MAAIARGGLNTLYAIQKATGLQPGSISNVIKRLTSAGLLTRSEGSKRGRRIMTLTAEGEGFLQANWRHSLDPCREMESILRSGTVALLMGEPGLALGFLSQSASERERRKGRQHQASYSADSTAMELYSAMRADYESRRWTMETTLLHDLWQHLATNLKNADRT